MSVSSVSLSVTVALRLTAEPSATVWSDPAFTLGGVSDSPVPILIIWTPSSRNAAAATCTWSLELNVVIPRIPLSSRSSMLVPLPAILPASTMLDGLVTSSICTPASVRAATATYT